MRAFIAVTLPEEIKNGLHRLQEKLRISQADVTWVDPAQLHLTLKFLDEIDETSRKEIGIALDKVAGSFPAFNAGLSTLGAFPRPESPRIIWVGMNAGAGQMQDVVQDLENQLIRIGIPKEERTFAAHITLGRTRSTAHLKELTQALISLKDQPGRQQLSFRVQSLTLFKSTLTPHGPIYEIVQESTLKTT